MIPWARLRALAAMICLTAAVGGIAMTAWAQSGSPYNERDDQYRLLGLKRAKEAYEIARERWEQKNRLHGEGVLPESELLNAKQSMSDAEVNYQQSLLAVLFEQQYVAVLEAVKFQSEGGRKVRIRLENASGGGAEYRQLVVGEEELFNSLRPEIIHDVYVSLGNEDGAIISQPYEAKLEELHYGTPADITFDLLQDVDTVTVFIAYGHNAKRSIKVFLQKDSTVDRVAVQSEQFAQEVELGSSATFDLTLELFSGTSDTFKLTPVNLPPQINRYFLDPASGARLSQFKFTESSRTRRAALRVSLPDRASDTVSMDQAIPFYVLAVPRNETNPIEIGNRHMTEAEIEELGIGYVRLELVPRGVGKLLVRVPQLFFSIEPTGVAEVILDVVNDGTRRLDNIEIVAEPPLLWEKTIDPTVIPSLAVGAEARVTLRFDPPESVAPGKYEIRVRSSSFADDRPIEAADKTIAVEVRPKVSLLLPTALAAVLVSLIAGMVFAGVKLSRR